MQLALVRYSDMAEMAINNTDYIDLSNNIDDITFSQILKYWRHRVMKNSLLKDLVL